MTEAVKYVWVIWGDEVSRVKGTVRCGRTYYGSLALHPDYCFSSKKEAEDALLDQLRDRSRFFLFPPQRAKVDKRIKELESIDD